MAFNRSRRKPKPEADAEDAVPRSFPQAGTVTRLEPQRRNRERMSVYLDGEFAFGLHGETVLTEHLHIGEALTLERATDLVAEDEARAAKETALVFLSARPRSEKEIRDRLRDGDYSDESIERTVESLRSYGFVDDEAYGRLVARDRLRLKPIGERKLTSDLRAKGLDPELIESVVGDAYEAQPADELIRSLLGPKLNRLRAEPDRQRARKRAVDLLMRRGFSWDDIKPVINEWLPSAGDEDVS